MRAIAAVAVALACRTAPPLPSAQPATEPVTRIVYRLDLDRVIDAAALAIEREIAGQLRNDGIGGEVVSSAEGEITIELDDLAIRRHLAAWVGERYPGLAERACDRTLCFELTVAHERALRQEALDQALATLRARVDKLPLRDPSVSIEGEELVAELPGIDEAGLPRIRSILDRAARLEIKLVDNDDGYMRRLFKQVRNDPEAARLGIEADVDGWRHDDTGDRHDDYYLFAHDRDTWVPLDEATATGCYQESRSQVEDGQVWCTVTGRQAIERYLAAITVQDPGWEPPEDRQLGYEKVFPGEHATDARPFWRSYFLEGAVRLAGSAVANAIPLWDPATNRPEVLIEFDRRGTQIFGELTTEAVGRKIAIILDDVIASAPVIQSSILGGRSNISMGGGTANEQEDEADRLVTALKAGALLAPLREVHAVTTRRPRQ